MMRKSLVVVVAAAGFSCLMGSSALALPLSNPSVRDLIGANPLAQEARVFCYNRYTGRFLHWGRCRGGYRPRFSRPRG